MPAKSKSQQRLFGMVHAYNKGELHGSRALRSRIAALSRHISDADAKDFAETPHAGLPERKEEKKASSAKLDGLKRRIGLAVARYRESRALQKLVSTAVGAGVGVGIGSVSLGKDESGRPRGYLLGGEKGHSRVNGALAGALVGLHVPALKSASAGSVKQAQAMLRPETIQELYGRVPVGEYGEMLVRSPRSTHRRSFLGHVLYGTGAGAILGGLGAAGLGAFIANYAASGTSLPRSAVNRNMLSAALQCGLWGAGRGAAVGSVVGTGLGVADKVWR